jgi:hypothetical protein
MLIPRCEHVEVDVARDWQWSIGALRLAPYPVA